MNGSRLGGLSHVLWYNVPLQWYLDDVLCVKIGIFISRVNLERTILDSKFKIF